MKRTKGLFIFVWDGGAGGIGREGHAKKKNGFKEGGGGGGQPKSVPK